MRGGKSWHPGTRWTGIGLLILGLLHVPLPQPDYHNVRHHDAPGEVCGYHDHLLRWHPDAGQASDVAVLHWHWFLPGSGPADTRDGAALHAHVVGWDAPTIEVGPPVVTREAGRFLDAPASDLGGLIAILRVVDDRMTSDGAGRPPVHAFGATFAPRVALACLLQRWTC
jgi:hypothetical protein